MTRVFFNSQITVGPLVVQGENDFYINVGLTGRQTNLPVKERSLSLLVGRGKEDRSRRTGKRELENEDSFGEDVGRIIFSGGNNFRFNLDLSLYYTRFGIRLKARSRNASRGFYLLPSFLLPENVGFSIPSFLFSPCFEFTVETNYHFSIE